MAEKKSDQAAFFSGTSLGGVRLGDVDPELLRNGAEAGKRLAEGILALAEKLAAHSPSAVGGGGVVAPISIAVRTERLGLTSREVGEVVASARELAAGIRPQPTTSRDPTTVDTSVPPVVCSACGGEGSRRDRKTELDVLAANGQASANHARRVALEDAEKCCLSRAWSNPDGTHFGAAAECAEEIRRLPREAGAAVEWTETVRDLSPPKVISTRSPVCTGADMRASVAANFRAEMVERFTELREALARRSTTLLALNDPEQAHRLRVVIAKIEEAEALL